jgi:hypothetical protein
MNCKKCIYCVQSKRENLKVVCSNKTLLTKLGLYEDYACIGEPCYCKFYKSKSQYLKERNKDLKEKIKKLKKKK